MEKNKIEHAAVLAAIAAFEAQASKLSLWVDGLTVAQLRKTPVRKTWSVHQLVVHMLDSDLAATHRMRRIAAEDTPLLIAYDESAFASNLRYHNSTVSMVCKLFELNRIFTAQWLATMPAEVFGRVGIHNQRGMVTLFEMIGLYTEHVTHHEVFLVQKRAAMKKPMKV